MRAQQPLPIVRGWSDVATAGELVTATTLTWPLFGSGTRESSMTCTQPGWAETIQAAHRSAGPLTTATGHATGTTSLRQVEEFLTHPNVIKRLPQGRCLLIRKHPGFSAEVLDVVIPAATIDKRGVAA